MADWLQALALVAVGGSISLVTAHFQHRWTTDAARKADERSAQRRNKEEERQARRQFRRDRLQPILDYHAKLQAFTAQLQIEDTLVRMDETLAAQRDAFAAERQKAWEEACRGQESTVDRAVDATRALYPALSVSSSPEMTEALVASFGELLPGVTDTDTDAARRLLELIEAYVSEV